MQEEPTGWLTPPKSKPATDAEIASLRAELEAVKAEREEARADSRMYEATAQEAARGLECLNDIDEAWDAFGTAGNRGTLTLAEQISSVTRELDEALDTVAKFVSAHAIERKQRLAAESELARLKDRVARLCDWIEHEVGVELPFDARGTLTTDNPGGDTARGGGEHG